MRKKILVIAGGLQIGGAERVAANISKYAPSDCFEFHYLVFDGIENVYGPEIERAGGKVFTIPSPSRGYKKYIHTIADLMKRNRYTAVHSHTMFNSGINLLVAMVYGVPHRIAHSHTTKTEKKVSIKQRIYEQGMRVLIRLTATDLMACGFDAGCWMFGENVFRKKGIVIRNGIDIEEFAWSAEKRKNIRQQYGLEDSFVIGHSGTLLPLKNQKFLIQILPKILEKKPNAKLMLLGQGTPEYTQELMRMAQEQNVEHCVFFCGGVSNVADYLNAFDVFAFPSLREGTPLALIEAQANGLPCIISDRIPKDIYLTNLITAIPLNKEDDWATGICGAQRISHNYADEIISKGYSAKQAYQPIYEAYER